MREREEREKRERERERERERKREREREREKRREEKRGMKIGRENPKGEFSASGRLRCVQHFLQVKI